MALQVSGGETALEMMPGPDERITTSRCIAVLDTAAVAEEEAMRLPKDALGLRTLLHRAIRDTETLLAGQHQDGITSGQHIMLLALEASQVALISCDEVWLHPEELHPARPAVESG